MDKQNTLGRSRLEEAIRQYECACYDALPTVQGEIPYSVRYQRRMASILRGRRRTQAYSLYALGKRTAAILLAAALLTGSVVSVSGARHTISDWLSEAYERFTELFFEGRVISRAPDTVQTQELPTFIPEGYTLHERYVAETETKTSWKNAEGEIIFFVQTTLGSKTTVDHETSDFEIVYVSDQKFAVSRKKGMQSYYWNGTEYAYSVIAPDTLEREICMQIIFSVDEYR